ncbi:phospholipase A1 isoform X2 [Drosophila mojavensis]|nr:phospholipase A1 isoform X2 [Drosophila mojavensis]
MLVLIPYKSCATIPIDEVYLALSFVCCNRQICLATNSHTAAVCFIPESEHINGENGWYVPRSDGSFYWIDKAEAEMVLKAVRSLLNDEIQNAPVDFYLFTKSNPTEGTNITATNNSIKESNFNANNPTRFIIHGWRQDRLSDMNNKIRDAWLSNGEYNVIVVEWASAQTFYYPKPVEAVSTVGKKVANMINYLASDHGLKFDTLHVIGHSLGAHVAGYTGKNTNGQVHTIIGLDTALPLFSYDKSEERLSSKDAYYVESIHTSGGTLGFLKPIGKTAFYPNGGKAQPGCGIDWISICAHRRSVIYYAEAVSHKNFGTIKCADYEAAVNKECGSTYSTVRMSADGNADEVEGVFYVPVNSESPHGNAN